MPTGRVVQAIGGFQTILAPDGRILTGRARGRLKRYGGEILVGDLVNYQETAEGPVIEEIIPRRQVLRRPLVANVDQAALIFALKDPEPSLKMIDRFLVTIIAAGLRVILCLNKSDLVRPGQAANLAKYYRTLGLPVILTSVPERRGRNKMLAELYGRTTVFCGPSGVGKSALLNMVQSRASLVTGELSSKIKRGKHTTRAARLLPLAREGFVIDTPGYTQVDLGGLNQASLLDCFPELEAHSHQCRFRGCAHLAEPDCSVKLAVARGLVPSDRYEHYCQFLGELRSGKTGKEQYR